jgi:hypothetical protein
MVNSGWWCCTEHGVPTHTRPETGGCLSYSGVKPSVSLNERNAAPVLLAGAIVAAAQPRWNRPGLTYVRKVQPELVPVPSATKIKRAIQIARTWQQGSAWHEASLRSMGHQSLIGRA